MDKDGLNLDIQTDQLYTELLPQRKRISEVINKYEEGKCLDQNEMRLLTVAARLAVIEMARRSYHRVYEEGEYLKFRLQNEQPNDDSGS